MNSTTIFNDSVVHQEATKRLIIHCAAAKYTNSMRPDVALVLIALIGSGLASTVMAGPDTAGNLVRQHALPTSMAPAGQNRLSLRTAANAKAWHATDNSTVWEAIGPAPILNSTMAGNGTTLSGRATAIAVHPLYPETLLLGAAQGGIWRSTDDGMSFSPVADNMPSMAIKVIRFAPSDPNIVYAGSGEPHSKTSIFGMGVFKSTDGGNTWVALPNAGADWDFRYLSISGLQVNPTNANELVVTLADVLPDRVNVFEAPPAGQTGIFKSTDGGQTWRCVQTATDYRAYAFVAHDPYLCAGLGFMDLELYRTNPAFMFASEYSGGIWRSTDGGENWQRVTPVKNAGGGTAVGANFPAAVPRFSYFDGNSATFSNYAVLARSNTVPEMNRIELGLAQAGGTLTTNINSLVLYAGCGTVLLLDVNTNGQYDAGIDLEYPMSVLFKSTDGGQNWSWMGDWYNEGIPAYCDVNDNNYEDAVYDNTVEVNPENPDDVVVGGNCNYAPLWPDPIRNPVRYLLTPWHGIVYRSVDGGSNWVDTTPAATNYVLTTNTWNGLPVYNYTEVLTNKTIHPDVHCAAYDWPRNRIYISQDGGLSRATVTGAGTNGFTDYTWEALNNNLGTLQFFQFGSHPTDPRVIQGGMQDNANACWNGTYWTAWDWAGSDGTIGKFDPLNPLVVYIGMQYSLYRADAGGSNKAEDWTTLFDSSIGADTDLPFVTLLAIDPVDTRNIYVVSTTGLYGSTNRGDTWSARLNSQDLTGVPTALDVIPRDQGKIWLGTSAGRIYFVDTQTRQATDVTGANLPNRYISKIKASPNARDTVYITFSGYDINSLNVTNDGNGQTGHVFKSTDGGQTWINISGNLTRSDGFDLPIAALAVDPVNEYRLWIGTDYAVMVTTNGGASWADYSTGIPAVAVMDLEYNIRTRYLMAATFGRSIWRIIPDTVADVSADYDGDAITDPAIFLSGTGTWRARLSGSGFILVTLTDFGQGECAAAPGDYDGDGLADPALYNGATGEWQVKLSTQGYTTFSMTGFGGAACYAVAADYDGDGKLDPATYQPATGLWSARLSGAQYVTATLAGLGGAGFWPVTADYDGDGLADPAVYHGTTGEWQVRFSTGGYVPGSVTGFGGPGYQPVMGDYDGDGLADPGVVDASNGDWYVMLSGSGYAIVIVSGFGGTGTMVLNGDYDGDGLADPAFYMIPAAALSAELSSFQYQQIVTSL